MRRTASRASGEIAAGVLPCALRRAFSATSAHDEERTAGMHPAGCFQDRPPLLRSGSYSLLYPLYASAWKIPA